MWDAGLSRVQQETQNSRTPFYENFFLLRRAPSSFRVKELTSRVPPNGLGHELRLSTPIRVLLSCTRGTPTSLDPKEGAGKGRGVPMS